MSNLVKKNRAIYKSQRIIDYNDIINNKLESMLEEKDCNVSDDFMSGLKADVVEELLYDGDSSQEEALQDICNLDEVRKEADEIINKATAQAETITQEAKVDSDRIYEEAKEIGYKEGIEKARQEIEEQKILNDQKLEDKIRQLDADYEKKKKQIEPELIEVLTEIFKKITLTVAQDNQDIILHLINNVIKDTKGCRNFTIKVSPDDYKFLIANQGRIYCSTANEIQMDIIEDASKDRNQCVIETEIGVFDCSLDIELNNLIKKIKLLSCI